MPTYIRIKIDIMCIHIYWRTKKKGYKIICLLFYKTELHILFAYCKRYVCYVCLGQVCQIWAKFSEAILRHINLNDLQNLDDIWTFGYYESQMVVRERKCSKPAENHQTLIINLLQETLTLAQYTQNDENIKIFGKASLLTLTNDLFVL